MARNQYALVVEDDEVIAYLIQFILSGEGYEVKLAHDGRAAQRIIAEDPPPAVVTLDVMLPHSSGFELVGAIRAQQGWHAVPILMVTSCSAEADIARALEAGADEYVIKPFDPDELRKHVRRLTKPRP